MLLVASIEPLLRHKISQCILLSKPTKVPYHHSNQAAKPPHFFTALQNTPLNEAPCMRAWVCLRLDACLGARCGHWLGQRLVDQAHHPVGKDEADDVAQQRVGGRLRWAWVVRYSPHGIIMCYAVLAQQPQQSNARHELQARNE